MAQFHWRLAFVAVVCLVIATEILAQPSVFEFWDPAAIASGLLDHYLTCLGFGVSMLLAVTAAERALPRLRPAARPFAMGCAIACGALLGGLVDVALHGLGWDYLGTARFTGDVLRWALSGAAVVGIYAHQVSATAARARMHRAAVERVALDRQMLEARLQVMRAQIEPHFLFNSLANVKRLGQSDLARGITMIDNLARYLRAALPQLRAGAATLGQEVDLVRAYLDIQQIRMGTHFAYALEVPPRLRELPFPSIMLLTLIENAVKHGLAPSSDEGRIDVVAREANGELVVSVADTGVGFGAAKTGGTGIGLANTRARLAALFGPGAALELRANAPRGVVASIRVPLARLAGPAALAQAA